MSNPTLNAVAIDVVGHYAVTSKNLVQAYRLGTQRVVSTLNTGYTNVLQSNSMSKVDDSIRGSLLAAHEQFMGFFVNGVAKATEQADLAIDRAASASHEGLKRLAGFGDRVKTVVGAPAVDTMTKLNMPAAQMSLQLAGAVSEGSKRLVERVAGVEDAVIAEAAEVKARTKRAATAAKA